MKRWDYIIWPMYSNEMWETKQARLNYYGKQGYELIQKVDSEWIFKKKASNSIWKRFINFLKINNET